MTQNKKTITEVDKKRIMRTIKWAEKVKIIHSTKDGMKYFKGILNRLKKSIK